MQNFMRPEVRPPVEAGSRANMQIAQVLLDLRQEAEYEEFDETIEYEIKFEYQDKPKLKSKLSSEAKKEKKYVMHPPDLKRMCVELVISENPKK